MVIFFFLTQIWTIPVILVAKSECGGGGGGKERGDGEDKGVCL